jgi:hypothetical protein
MVLLFICFLIRWLVQRQSRHVARATLPTILQSRHVAYERQTHFQSYLGTHSYANHISKAVVIKLSSFPSISWGCSMSKYHFFSILSARI